MTKNKGYELSHGLLNYGLINREFFANLDYNML